MATREFSFETPSLPVSPRTLDRAFWFLVTLTVVGDLATTAVGLQLGLVESNPVGRAAIEGYGLVGILTLKAFAIGVGLACRPLCPRSYQFIVPACLALPWSIAVVLNSWLILSVV
ncbi:hypothetical protein [Natrialba aegyptia]|uniref:DUF5658 domain-containing protein n=1 Tax=Natrialba aegyptia DSM 13077 TaxID=1227491 RepID=M0B807_9EURY|nr:hypothetical protein [Natrialba aegyptia]ELZ05784.1 hypothetical protein C480_10315 [Natrialba aegyptia DSM 13077]